MSGFYFGEMQTHKVEHSSNTGKVFKHEEWQKAIDRYPQQGSIQKSTACCDIDLRPLNGHLWLLKFSLN